MAVNIAPRNVILLCEREDLTTVSGGGGPGQHRLLDITGFGKAVVIGAFAEAGLPLSAGVKIANALWSYRPGQLTQALAQYMSQEALASIAFNTLPRDVLATIYDGRHLIFREGNRTIISFPNYISSKTDQPAGRYYVDPQIAGSIGFSDKRRFFDHLLNHGRVQVKVNVYQALRRAALQMQRIKFG